MDVLRILKIFLISGRELGRRQSFFYNDKNVVLSVGLEESHKLEKKITIMDVSTKDASFRSTAIYFRSKGHNKRVCSTYKLN